MGTRQYPSLCAAAMKPILMFGDPDVERTKLLQEAFRDQPQLIARAVKSPELMRLPGVDAVYLSVMAAERWGARPISREAQVLQTRPDDQERGLPPFVIAGVALGAEDPRDPEFGLRMIISSVLSAVRRFNETTAHTIQNVAFGPEWTGIEKLAPHRAAEIIRAAYDEAPG